MTHIDLRSRMRDRAECIMMCPEFTTARSTEGANRRGRDEQIRLPGAWLLVVVAIVMSAVVWWNAASLDRAERQCRLAERRLAAQYTATSVLAESPRPAEAVPGLLRAVCQSLGWEIGAMWRVDSR